MGPNIWNALRMQSEFLECTSNIQECTKKIHSDGIRAHVEARFKKLLNFEVYVV